MANSKKTQPARFAVSATREGFRRAGRSWSTVPVELEASQLNKDQWQALKQDPMIQVVQMGGQENPPVEEAAPKEQQEATQEVQDKTAKA